MSAPTKVSMTFKGRFKTVKPVMYLYAIYPDFWAGKWGNPPLLGFVHAEDEFHALRKAEMFGIYYSNLSFGAKAVQVESRKIRLGRKELYSH